ncbi:neuronal acetylcholine receptor subunit alpha-6-like [Mercenaria mercenaria]|uniref:neuronal acetylcholine receptor subunit alpha-6-like n=1 Tax=Mercenaria mercenaria TaxID=6596 RepID=UPI00234EAA9B|nr:neuronal acetylcholine receptor subunit alpha-6-like [Mercenaria mercenaria]
MELNHKVNAFFTILFMLSYVKLNNCASINDTNILLRDLLKVYNKNVRPVENQKNAVHVNTSLLIVSIQELDEIRGIFSVMGILSVQWHDANMVWNPETYGGVKYVMTSYKEVWVPELILINPAEEADTLGKKWQRVYFHHTGYASWWPGDLIKSTCALDVSRYPFDTQECIITFAAWGYFAGQVKINPINDRVDLSFYTESSTWKLAKSEVNVIDEGTQISFHVYLERKAGFVIVNIVLPLTFLSLLNAFVFLLLPESGERISYCITVLLSIAVFMTIVSETLPKSSEPVPFISYKLMFDMVISSVITLVTILNLRLYNRNETENIPHWLQSMYLFLARKRSMSKIRPIKDNAKGKKNEVNQSKAGNGNTCMNRKGSERRDSRYLTDMHISRKPSVALIDLEEVPNERIEKQLWPGDLIKSTCALDVSRYPFDTQECIISFSAWGYFAEQVKINPANDRVDLSYYTESSTWKIAKSEANVLPGGMQINFHVYLERKAGFVIVNIVLPLTFLSLLNVFVFLLLPESGERISYCITVLLSIAVFMTIVSETLPKSSEPVPVISYKLMFDMVISSVITLVTILNLRLYNRNETENIPHWLQSKYLFLARKRSVSKIRPIKDNAKGKKNEVNQSKAGIGNACMNRKGSERDRRDSRYMLDMHISRKPSVALIDLEEVPNERIEKRLVRMISEAEENGDFQTCVNWKNISNMVDGIAFVLFILLSVFSVVFFMIITFK